MISDWSNLTVTADRERQGLDVVPVTESERRVLQLLADDYSNSEIAEVLVCSPETMKSHASHILRKLGVADRREAAQLWRRKDHP